MAALLVAVASGRSGAQKGGAFVTAFQFDVADTVAVREVALDPSLTLRVEREAGVGKSAMGWVASVSRRPRTSESGNLLYHSRELHGAYPTDLFAWQLRTGYFGPERSLPVFGYPYDVEVVCGQCTVVGDSTDNAHFTGGTVRVRWRKLPRANPAQLTDSTRPETQLSAAALHQDFLILGRVYKELHPGVSRYNTPAQMAVHFAELDRRTRAVLLPLDLPAHDRHEEILR